MYTELQKFAVAMEALIQNDPKSVRLNETNDYLIQVLAKSTFLQFKYVYTCMISRAGHLFWTHYALHAVSV
jgi:hypothetical protein